MKKIIRELIPVLVMVVLLVFFRSEVAITIFAVIIIAITFRMKHEKRELTLFLFGCVMGIIFELTGNYLLNQKWGEASFFTIPVWLPLTWGYGFVIIRRIGNIIVNPQICKIKEL